MGNSAYFVKSTSPRALYPFLNFTGMLQTLKMCMWKFNDEKILLVNITPFFT